MSEREVDLAGLPVTQRRRPDNFHAQVIRSLGTEIVTGAFPEFALLPGDVELTERFHVSRTVLREAMKTLAAKGMVEARARVGTRVLPRTCWNMFDSDVLDWHLQSGLQMEFVRSLAEVRLAVEPEAAALAAIRRSDQQADDLMQVIERMAVPGQNAREFATHDVEFHSIVATASGNPFMVALSGVIETAVTATFTLSSPVSEQEAFLRTVRLHRAIAEAVSSRDPQAARERMRDVITAGLDRCTENLGA